MSEVMSRIHFSFVPVDHVNAVWEKVAHILEPAVGVCEGRWLLYDVYCAIQQSEMQLWIAFDEEKEIIGVHVTKLTQYPQRLLVTSLFTGGTRFREWRNELLAVTVAWAKDEGASGIEGQGRIGWVKMMEPYGVKPIATLFELEF